jgi:hypothetical protein
MRSYIFATAEVKFGLHFILAEGRTVALEYFNKIVLSLIRTNKAFESHDEYRRILNQKRLLTYRPNGAGREDDDDDGAKSYVIESTETLIQALEHFFGKLANNAESEMIFEMKYTTSNEDEGSEFPGNEEEKTFEDVPKHSPPAEIFLSGSPPRPSKTLAQPKNQPFVNMEYHFAKQKVVERNPKLQDNLRMIELEAKNMTYRRMLWMKIKTYPKTCITMGVFLFAGAAYTCWHHYGHKLLSERRSSLSSSSAPPAAKDSASSQSNTIPDVIYDLFSRMRGLAESVLRKCG